MADSPRHSDVAAPGPELAHTTGKLRILVADDNRINRAVIAKILERAGYKVEIVSDGEQALDALEARAFDLVLMDIHMPVMTGIEAAKLYRFISLGERRVPILALTVDATLETATRCTEAGMDGCVTKPVEPPRLLEAINQVVSCQESISQPAIGSPEQVMDIASHQSVRLASQATFDRGTLAGFEALGGRNFLTGLIHDFITDSELLLTDLARAAESGDIRLFRARCYDLQTAAGEVGGQALRDLCIDIRKIRPLSVNQGLVNRITREFDRLRHDLLQYCAADDETRLLTFRSHPDLLRAHNGPKRAVDQEDHSR